MRTLGLFVLLSLATLSRVAGQSCSVATSLSYPLQPWANYNNTAGPFLDPVWFTAGSVLCGGGAPTDPSVCGEGAYWKLHLGEDLNATDGSDLGDSVHAIANGLVAEVAESNSWGWYVLIRHQWPNGQVFFSLYAHLQEPPAVANDECVDRDDVIGLVGATGTAAVGAHLHFEIRTSAADVPGRGYAHHWDTETLDHYTDPSMFIDLFHDQANRVPPAATNPEPETGEVIGDLDICTDDRGTLAAADDFADRRCLQWTRPPHTVFQDVFVNGGQVARVYGYRPIQASSIRDWATVGSSLLPGTYTWRVVPSSPWATNTAVPTWTFQVPNYCTAASIEDGAALKGGCTGGAPVVTTNPASNRTQASAALNMTVDPNSAATSVWFAWGPTMALGNTTSPPKEVGGGDVPVQASISIGGLACNKTYYFSARGRSPVDDAEAGAILSFQTTPCTTAGPGELELVEDPSFERGDHDWWEAGSDFYIDSQYDNPRTGSFYAYLSRENGLGGNNLEGGVLSQAFTIPYDTLDLDLRYHYSITSDETTTSVAYDKLEVYLIRNGDDYTLLDSRSNLDETAGPDDYDVANDDIASSFYGDEVQLFFRGTTDGSLPTTFRVDDVSVLATTADDPVVVNGDADQITSSSARLSMSVDPNGGDTEVWFEFAPNDSTPSPETEHIDIGGGRGARDISISVYGLECDTRYFYEAQARNQYGLDIGEVVDSFRTEDCVGGEPRADTDPAQSVTQSSAVLTADITPNGLPTDAWFEWWRTASSPRTSTARRYVGSSMSSRDFDETVPGLECGTKYFFEAFAENSADQDDGVTLDFETAACPEVVSVHATDNFANEYGLGTGSFRLIRSGALTTAISVFYAVDGTASNGVDYEVLDGTVAISEGQSYADVVVRPLQDVEAEDNETVELSVQEGPGYTIGTPSRDTVTLSSDDGTCDVRVVSPENQTVIKGTPVAIRWVKTGVCGSYQAISLVNAEVGDRSIVSDVEGDEFLWVPPAFEVPSAAYRVRVQVIDFDGLGDGAGETDRFTIENPIVLPRVILSETWDGHPQGWSNYLWGTASGLLGNATRCRTTIPYNFDGARITSALLDISGRSKLRLVFRHLPTLDGDDTATVSATCGVGEVRRVVRGFLTQWSHPAIDLNECVGSETMRLEFELRTGAGARGGWSVDDIALYEPGLLDFHSVPPCRVIDTRQGSGPLSDASGNEYEFQVAGLCGIPPEAEALSVNATVIDPTSDGHVRIGGYEPGLNEMGVVEFLAGKTRANNAVLEVSFDGRVSALPVSYGAGCTLHLTVDVNGYFAQSVTP